MNGGNGHFRLIGSVHQAFVSRSSFSLGYRTAFRGFDRRTPLFFNSLPLRFDDDQPDYSVVFS